MRRKLLAALGGVLLAAAGWMIWNLAGPRHTPAGQPALLSLEAGGLESLRAAFNAAQESTRVMVLLSPT